MRLDAHKFANEAEALSKNSSRVPPDFNIADEAAHLSFLINEQPQIQDRLKEYDDPQFEGAGGSGVVLNAMYKPFNTRRTIKFPRKSIYDQSSKEADVADVDPELHALSKVSHANITRLYDSFRLEGGKGHCVVTEYIAGAKPFDDFSYNLCSKETSRSSPTELASALRRVTVAVYQIVDALRYMHDNAFLLHFDLKPDNILVGDTEIPYITDLGFAREMSRYQDDQSVDIGFTWKYAHPELIDPYTGARVTRTPAKAKNSIKANQLGPRFDIYAFGRTMQEMLGCLRREYMASIESQYDYNFLHIVACLCLDARNAAGETGEGNFVSDEALGIPARIFAEHRLKTFAGIQATLDRLLGRRRLEDDLPEVDRWSVGTINCSDLGVTTLTNRVAPIIRHPAVSRLKGEMQLGLLRQVFPTASHSRLEHSLAGC